MAQTNSNNAAKKKSDPKKLSLGAFAVTGIITAALSFQVGRDVAAQAKPGPANQVNQPVVYQIPAQVPATSKPATGQTAANSGATGKSAVRAAPPKAVSTPKPVTAPS